MTTKTVKLKFVVSGGETASRQTKEISTGMINLASAFYLAEQALSAINTVMDKFINSAIELEKELAVMGAIVGETTDDFDKFTESMRQQALYMSVKYPVAADEVARGMIGIAQAGFNAGEVISMTDHIMALATATNADFADSAAVVVTSMRAMGLTVNETERLVNDFQYAVNRSRNNMQDLANSLKFVTGFAHTMGLSLESVVSAQMSLVNAGLEAGIAGRTLQQMLVDIVRPSQQAQEVIDRLGLQFFDANGYMKDMVGIAEELRRVFGTTTLTQQQAADMATIFGSRSLRATTILRQSVDIMKKYENEMASGVVTASAQAQFAMMSLSAMITKVKNLMMVPFLQDTFLLPLKTLLIENISKFEELAKTMSENLMAVMVALIPLFEAIVELLNNNNEGLQLWVEMIIISAQALTILVRVLDMFGGHGLQIVSIMILMSKIYKLATLEIWANIAAKLIEMSVTLDMAKADLIEMGVVEGLTVAEVANADAIRYLIVTNIEYISTLALLGGILGGTILAFLFWNDITKTLGKNFTIFIGIVVALTAAIVALRTASGGIGVAARTIAAGAATFVGMGLLMDKMKKDWTFNVTGPSKEEIESFNKQVEESQKNLATLQAQRSGLNLTVGGAPQKTYTWGGAYATGFHGYVNQPTLMLVGEAGTEKVDVTPNNDIGSNIDNNGPVINNTIYVTDVNDGRVVREIRRQLLISRGFTTY